VQSEVAPDFHRWISEELFDHVPLAICVVDPQFRIVEANGRFTELYGEWRGRFCYEVYKDRSERCARCGAAKTFRDGKTRQREEEGVDRQGSPTHYVVNIVPVVRDNGDVPYVIEMSRDIAELKTLQRQKLEAERLAAVGQTVAGLAHGIKNLIMGLEGGMYVVNSGLRGSNEQRVLQGWKMLEEDIGRISSFVKEFLEFAKGRQPRVQMIQPNDVARVVVERYRERAARSGVDLGLEPGELGEAPFDEDGLHTCLTNLVLNAIDACVMSTQEGCQVTVSSREKDGVLTFEVSDDGCGMDYDIKQKVFTNFFSTKASGKGTGLGLLTTRKIVQEHGGQVSFDSTEGEGSVFRLRFPRENLPQPQAEEAAA
jgi:PAS domain S-box-containing protein